MLVLDGTLPGARRDAVFQKVRPALAALPDVESVEASGAEWLKAAPELAAWAIWNRAAEPFTRVVAALGPGPVRARLDELPSVPAGALDPEALAWRQFDSLGVLDVLGAEQGDSRFQWTEGPACFACILLGISMDCSIISIVGLQDLPPFWPPFPHFFTLTNSAVRRSLAIS